MHPYKAKEIQSPTLRRVFLITCTPILILSPIVAGVEAWFEVTCDIWHEMVVVWRGK